MVLLIYDNKSNNDCAMTSVSLFSILSLYISFGTENENSFNNQSFLGLAIIPFVLMTVQNDPAVIL